MQLQLNSIRIEMQHLSTNALFGVCQTWIARGKKKSAEMTDFLENAR